MKLYTAEVAGTGEELCVAARTMSHAAEVFVTFWLARRGEAPGEFQVSAGAPAVIKNDPVAIHAADGHIPGILVRQLDGGLLFDPADA